MEFFFLLLYLNNFFYFCSSFSFNMTRFIIYSCLNNSRSNVLATKSIETTKPHLHQHHQMGQPIGLIDCQQIVREPTSQLETKSLYTNHHTIEIVPLSSSQTYDDQSDDSCSILLESNLVCLHISLTGQQTLELQFNLGLERFFLIGSPNVKLLLCGILRLHQPCLEVLYGLTQCHLTGNTAIHVNDIVIDIYSKFERFERLSDRRRLAYSFFQLVPKLYDSNRMLMSNHGIENKMSETNSANFLIYFRMNEHRRPVALFEGELHCSPTETYKRFECESQLYPQKQFPEINSSLEVCVIMNELQNQHRKFILKHSNLSTIVITGLETQCHVFGLRKPYFSFNLGSIKIAGYLVVRDRQQNGSNQLVSGQGEVVIKNGSAILYIDDYFAILTINSENAEHEIVQSFNKEKEFKSISLMNCNKRRQSTCNKP